jgi:DnaJ family protein C protein 19
MVVILRRQFVAALSGENQLSSLSHNRYRRLYQNTTQCSTAVTNIPLKALNRDKQDESSAKIVRAGNLTPPLPGRFSLSQSRSYQISARKENLSLVMSLGAVALTAKAAQYGVRAYKEWQESHEFQKKQQDDGLGENAREAQKEADKQNKAASGESQNIFSQLFGFSVGSKYYEGGFEERMSRREAALILGVRESSSAKRIKEAHRRILILNHPDTGGSNYLASKVNEAKELLLKGKE